MKRTPIPHQKSLLPPMAWREAEYDALKAGATDTFDDRVSEDIFDFEDERAEIELIVHAMDRNEN